MKKAIEDMSPLELEEEMSALQAAFTKAPDDVRDEDLRRAVQITRALRKTHTGPAKTRTKTSAKAKAAQAAKELNLDELFG